MKPAEPQGLPGNRHSVEARQAVHNTADLGQVVRQARRDQGLTQLDVSGLANTGNRFVVEFERGKPTIQMQKAMDILALLGLELVIRRKGNT